MLENDQKASGPAFQVPVPVRSPGPRSCSRADLERVGVVILSESSFHLQCVQCQQVWSPNMLRGGRLPRGYWKCPNGCNTSHAGGKESR